ncbi:MAG: elongation factor P [Anaerolineales bacterium]|nr:elongation factor P [Anaerolineales bacterium]MCB9127814.1 elongation factor P [Ardenticatenales bacterium]
MISASDFRNGTTFEMDGELYRVLTQSQTHMGRGGATVRAKLRNLRSGSTMERTFGPDDRFEAVRLEMREVQFLYNDGELYHFMDTETYEQPVIGADALADRVPYMKENMVMEIAFHDGEPIEIELPAHVDLEVTYTEPGHAGDTAQGATKPAETETGLTVDVPLFVNIGTVIRVDTRNGKYITRV